MLPGLGGCDSSDGPGVVAVEEGCPTLLISNLRANSEERSNRMGIRETLGALNHHMGIQPLPGKWADMNRPVQSVGAGWPKGLHDDLLVGLFLLCHGSMSSSVSVSSGCKY